MSEQTVDAETARRQLYSIMDADRPFDAKAEAALEIGEAYLGVDNGHLARLDPETNYWRAIASTDPPDGSLPAGTRVDFGTTYCRHAVAAGTSLAIENAVEQGFADDPAFETHGIHCYHGTVIEMDGEPYGTACFVSTEPREEAFSEAETTFAELLARLLEHELRVESLESARGRIERSIDTVRHDLRNPLSVAKGWIELERERRDSEPLEKSANALDRMEVLIEDGLSVAGQSTERNDVEMIGLSAFVRRCWETTDTGDADLVVEGDCRFRGDPTRLRQALENLLRNAVEHGSTSPDSQTRQDAVEHGSTDPDSQTTRRNATEPGSNVTVRVGALAGGEGFYVADDGPGIPPERRTEVFESGVTTDESGVGLGLSIVAGIVDAHGWSIRITESESGGARFEITNVAGELADGT